MKNFPKSFFNPQGIEHVIDESRILVAFKKVLSLKEVHNIAKDLKLIAESDEKTDANKHWIQVNHTDQRYWLRTIDGNQIDDSRFTEIEKKLGDRIEWIGPVYRTIDSEDFDGYFCPIPDAILIKKSRNPQTNFTIEAIAKEYGLRIDENKSKYLTAHYYLQIEDLKRSNVFDIKSRLEKLQMEAHYENMPMMKPLCATIPNDPMWASQWNLTQINAPNGWDISTGTNSVVICILDEGCDLTHLDLQYSEPGINLGTMLPTGAPTGNHGTACAGIAAATFDNNVGVAGVAGDCRIMPLAVQNWTDVEIANGINYATTNGADVISMSFGWNAWNHW